VWVNAQVRLLREARGKKEPLMIGMFMLFLLLQGPRILQVDENDKIMPPLVVPAGTTITVPLKDRI
jgi:hypothetical protein